jgi:hypothetical protein
MAPLPILLPLLKSNRQLLLLASLFWLVSVLVRLDGITSLAPQGDELIWLKRSGLVLQKWREHSWHDWSTHLTHPGIPPSVVMALGQAGAEKWNRRLALSEGDPWYLDALSGSRLALTLITSTIAPLAFIVVALVFDPLIAACLGVILLFEPILLETGRIAHVDGMLSVLILLTVLCFVVAEYRVSWRLMICAGALWGLAVATKALAILILPGLCFFKFALWCYRKFTAPNGQRYSPLRWEDLWALLAGQFVLCGLYTRFWVYANSPYRGRLGIKSSFADGLYVCSRFLAAHRAISLTIAGAIAVVAYYLYRKRSLLAPARVSACARGSIHLIGILLLLVVTCTLRPALLQNCVLFWCWVLGLHGTAHDGGSGIAPPRFGYAEFLLTKGSEFALLGFGLGACILIWSLLSRSAGISRRISVKSLLLGLSLAITFSWAGILSMTGKQSVRYLAPVMPFFALCSAYGWGSSLARLRTTLLSAPYGRLLYRCLFCLLLVGSAAPVLYHPNYQTYFNLLTGGVARAKQVKLSYHEAGHPQLFSRLHQELGNQERLHAGRPRVALVSGEQLQVVRYGYFRLFPEDRGKVIFAYLDTVHIRQQQMADFILMFGMTSTQQSVLERIRRELPITDVLRFYFQNELMGVLYAIGPQKIALPRTIPWSNLNHHTGKKMSMRGPRTEELQELRLSAQSDLPGYALFGAIVTPAAPLLVQLETRAQCDAAQGASLGAAIIIEVANDCRWEVQLQELCHNPRITRSCAKAQGNNVEVRVFWPGKYSLSILHGVTLSTE